MAKKGLLHQLHIWLLAVIEFYELLQRTAVQAVIDSRSLSALPRPEAMPQSSVARF
jgi:hypothetical protein